jgi:outer membrane protein assembly factor BamE (lipoprotein component of BamABCDE complex)
MPAKITDHHVVAVYFDKEKKVKRIADYGLEDGKPIDFVTRQTPTAGAESNLVRSMMGAMSNISSLSPF